MINEEFIMIPVIGNMGAIFNSIMFIPPSHWVIKRLVAWFDTRAKSSGSRIHQTHIDAIAVLLIRRRVQQHSLRTLHFPLFVFIDSGPFVLNLVLLYVIVIVGGPWKCILTQSSFVGYTFTKLSHLPSANLLRLDFDWFALRGFVKEVHLDRVPLGDSLIARYKLSLHFVATRY